MRLLIDARKLGDGGIGRYTASLLSALEHEPVHVTALVQMHQRAMLPRSVTPLVTHLKPYSLKGFLSLASQIPWKLFDVFHSPHFMLPRNVPIPSVVTIHDLIPLSHPVNVLHQRVMHYLLARVCNKANAVITVSRASAKLILDMFGKQAAIVPNILPFPACSSDRDINSEPYVVGVFSNAKMHKGQKLFAQACAQCGVRGVAIGKGSAMLSGMEGISVFPELPWEQLLEMYSKASVLVVSSLVEGFCLPAMEAKALGVRVASTPEPAVLELLDENDEVAKEFSSNTLALALKSALNRPHSPYHWSRATEFYPERVAKNLISVYHRAVATS